MLIYASPDCLVHAGHDNIHLCDACYVEYVLPSLDVVMTNWATYKLVVA